VASASLGEARTAASRSAPRGTAPHRRLVPPPTGAEAFRWTEAGGMVGLGKLPGGNISTRGPSPPTAARSSGKPTARTGSRRRSSGGRPRGSSASGPPGRYLLEPRLRRLGGRLRRRRQRANDAGFEAFVWTAATAWSASGTFRRDPLQRRARRLRRRDEGGRTQRAAGYATPSSGLPTTHAPPATGASSRTTASISRWTLRQASDISADGTDHRRLRHQPERADRGLDRR